MAQVHPHRSPESRSLQSVFDPHSSNADTPAGHLAFSSLASTEGSQSSSSQIAAHPHLSRANIASSTAPQASAVSASNLNVRRPLTGGSSGGGNTELRAQIRKEREAARHVSKDGDRISSTSVPNSSDCGLNSVDERQSASDAQRRPADATFGAPSQHGAQNSTLEKETPSEFQDHKEPPRVQDGQPVNKHTSSQAIPILPRVELEHAFDGKHQRAQTQPLNLQGRADIRPSSSESSVGSHFVVNPKRLSSGSAVAAAVRKLEEDAKAHLNAPPYADAKVHKERRSDERGQMYQGHLDGPPSSNKGSLNPPESYEHSFGMEALQAAFSAKYYELASKCKNWERYAARLRAQNEALEVENRLLRETNGRHETQLLALESENATMKDQSAIRENRAREVESRLSSLEQRLSHTHIPQRAHASSGPSTKYLQDLRSTLEDAYAAPSPPKPSESCDVSTSDPRYTAPYHSSNLNYDDEDQRQHGLRAPTPLTDSVLPRASRLSQEGTAHASRQMPQIRNHSGHTQRDSIVTYDAANRDHADAYGEGRASRLGNRTLEGWHGIHHSGVSASMTEYASVAEDFSGLTQGVALTSQALAAFDDHHTGVPGGYAHVEENRHLVNRPEHSQVHRMASSPDHASAMAGQKRSTIDPPLSMVRTGSTISQSQPTVSRQISGTLPKVRSNTNFNPDSMRTSASLPTIAQAQAEAMNRPYTGQMSSGPRTHVQQVFALNQPHVRVRSGSAISDAGTITGWPHNRAQTHNDVLNRSHVALAATSSSEYLAEQVSQRKQLRRTSMSQQQQFAQIQAQREASLAGSDGVTQPPSRSASRSSNLSGEGHGRQRGSKTRSRAGSASVHDSIPTIKDDIFSDGRISALGDSSANARPTSTISHSQSNPTMGTQSRVALASQGPPPSNSHGMGRGPSPMLPLSNITNTHSHVSHDPGSGDYFRASSSDGALNALKPAFGRTASGSSLNSQTSVSQHTNSSGQLAHQSSNLSQTSSHHVQEASASSTEGLAQIDEELSAEAKRGAHRRLYISLREELQQAEIIKFEKYVHRYDALEIPLDGPRGLVNRVKKLLILSDPSLKDRPVDLKRRKDLAREFERVVRADTEESQG
ncbi:unnamed protein product [Sympodiomycopsis kandeliae]